MPPVLLGQKPEVTKEEKVEYTTGFLILVAKDGSYELEANINRVITVDRQPTSHDIKGGLNVILSDIQANETAILATQMTIGNLMAQAQRAQEMQANAQVMQHLGQNK